MDAIGRYQLQGEIGRGSLTTVYKAYDPASGDQVAVKLLPRQFLADPSAYARFRREVDLVNLLAASAAEGGGPGLAILPVLDSGEITDQAHQGYLYIITPYMAGGSLANRLRRGPLSLAQATRLLRRLAPAIDAVHAAGVLHRDLTPGNILFDEHGQAFLADFGVLKLAEAAAIAPPEWTLLGPPAYLSPEQSLAVLAMPGGSLASPAPPLPIDQRSDLYALGVLLYEMLAGETPFKASSALGMAMQHISAAPPSLQALRPELPAGIDLLLNTALAKNPNDRFGSAAELLDILSAVAGSPGETGGEAAPPAISPEQAPQTMTLRSSQQLPILPTALGISDPGATGRLTLVSEALPDGSPTLLSAAPPRSRRGACLSALALLSLLAVILAGAAAAAGYLFVRSLGPGFLNSAITGLLPQVVEQPAGTPDVVIVYITATPQTIFVTATPQDLSATLLPAILPAQPTPSPTPVRLPGLPVYTATPDPLVNPETQVYTVQYNDTLFDVAARLNTDLGYLMALNNLQCDSYLYPRAALLVPPQGIAAFPAYYQPLSMETAASLRWQYTFECVRDVTDVAFSPPGGDGPPVLAVARGSLIYFYRVGSWKPLRKLDHKAPITAILYSPDGRLLASAAANGSIRLWNPQADAEVALVKTLTGHRASVTGLAFSRQADAPGRLLASSSLDQTARIWDVETGSVLQRFSGYAAHSVAFAPPPQGETLAVGYIDSVQVYRPESAAGPWTPAVALESGDVVRSLAFSPDGSLLASSSDVWQVQEGKLVYHLGSSGHEVLFSPDGRLLASGARFWQVANGRPMNALRSPVPPAERTTYAWDSLALSPDGGLLAWGNLDGLFLFGLPSAGPIAATPTPLPGVTVQAGDTFYNIAETLDVSLPALLSANGLSCSHVPYIGQALQPPVQPGYDPASGQVVSQPLEAANIHRLTELHRLLRDCAGPPGHVSLSVGGAPGGQVVASSASLWRIRRGSLFIQSGSPDARDFSPALVFSPDGSLLAVRSANEIELWDVASGRLLRTLSGHTDRVVALAFSPDGRRLASVSDVDEGHIRLWDLDSSQTVKTFTGFSAERLTFSPDGARLIAELSGSARFYDVQTGGLLNTLQGVQGSLATSQNPGVIAFAACSKWQGDNCLNSVINLYRTSDWKISGTLLGQKDIVHSPAFSPDGRYLAAAAEYTISVWQIENGVSISGQPVYKLRARPDNQEIIHHVFFSPDGSLMVSVSTANVVRFWRITDGELIATLPVQPDEIAFAPDGRGLAVRVGDQVSVWGVAP